MPIADLIRQEPEQRRTGEEGAVPDRRDDADARRRADRVVARCAHADREPERGARTPQDDADQRERQARDEPEDQQAGDREHGAQPKHRNATVPVEQTCAEQSHRGHRGDKQAESQSAGRVGLVEPVDDGEADPVVRRPLGEGCREHDQADEERAGLEPRPEGASGVGDVGHRVGGRRRRAGRDVGLRPRGEERPDRPQHPEKAQAERDREVREHGQL